jgi:translation initiation factor IF-3
MAKDLEENAELQQAPKREGRNMIMFLSPRRQAVSKPPAAAKPAKPVVSKASAAAPPVQASGSAAAAPVATISIAAAATESES